MGRDAFFPHKLLSMRFSEAVLLVDDGVRKVLKLKRFVHECIADREAGQTEKVMYQELLLQFHLSASVNNFTNHFNNS